MSGVRALLVAVEQYDPDSHLPRLIGTIDRALEIRAWLIDQKGAAPEDIFLCASPKVDEAGYSATLNDILGAAADLARVGQDATSELYFLHSGHGFQYQPENWTERVDVIVGQGYKPTLGGADCLNLLHLRTYLTLSLGPGTHVYFIDACRTLAPFAPSDVTLPRGQTSRLGDPMVHSLYAAAPGEVARTNSKFMPSLLTSLRGQGAAKEWIDGGYWVTFPRVVRVVKEAVADENVALDPHPGPEPARLYHVAEVTPVSCTVSVQGADPEESFVLRLVGKPGNVVKKFVTPVTVDVHPGDYFTDVSCGDASLAPLEPETNEVAIYAKTTLCFLKAASTPLGEVKVVDVDGAGGVGPSGGDWGELASGGGGDFDAPGAGVGAPGAGAPSIGVGVPGRNAGGDFGGEIGQGWRTTVSLSLTSQTRGTVYSLEPDLPLQVPSGEYTLRAIELGHQIGTLGVHVPSGALSVHRFEEIVPPSPLKLLLNGFGTDRDRTALNLGELMDLPEHRPGTVADPDPILLLMLLGAAAVCDQEPYTGVVGGLDTFDELSPGHSALYVLESPGDQGTIRAQGKKRRLRSIEGLDGVAHASLKVDPGPVFLELKLPAVPAVILSTHAFVNRATVVAISRTGERLTFRQQALPVGHVAQERLDDPTPSHDFGLLRMVQFGDLLQRRFAARQPFAFQEAESLESQMWQALLHERWPDAISPVLAAFDLVRRGELGCNPQTVMEVVEHLTQSVGSMPDLEVLTALAKNESRPSIQSPLLLDALLAAADVSSGLGKNAPRYLLDYGGPWVSWKVKT